MSPESEPLERSAPSFLATSSENTSLESGMVLTYSRKSAMLTTGDSEEMRELCSVTAAPRLRAELGVSVFLPVISVKVWTIGRWGPCTPLSDPLPV